MTLKNGFVKCSLFVLFYQPVDEKIKIWLFVFPPKKTLYGEDIVWLTNRVAVWRQSEVSIDFYKVLDDPFDHQIALFLFVCCFIHPFSCPLQRYTKIALTGPFVNKQMRAGSSPLIFLFLRQPIAEFPALTAPACSSLLCSLPFSRTFSYWPFVPTTWLIIRILLSADTIKTINGNLIWKQRKRGQTMVRSL